MSVNVEVLEGPARYGKGEGSEHRATVRATVDGENYVYDVRALFDAGLVVNPEDGGVARKVDGSWEWWDFDYDFDAMEGRGWVRDRAMTDTEEQAYRHVRENARAILRGSYP